MLYVFRFLVIQFASSMFIVICSSISRSTLDRYFNPLIFCCRNIYQPANSFSFCNVSKFGNDFHQPKPRISTCPWAKWPLKWATQCITP